MNPAMVENWKRQRDKMDEIINSYQNLPTNLMSSKDLVEWRILNEGEEVDNLYVANKTLFINDSNMILKGVDGKTETWDIVKTYPIDKKDLKINELEEEIKKLKEMINNEHSKSDEPVGKCDKSDGNDDGYVEPKPKTSSKYVSKQAR